MESKHTEGRRTAVKNSLVRIGQKGGQAEFFGELVNGRSLKVILLLSKSRSYDYGVW